MAKPLCNPRARLAYEFTKAHRREFPIEVMCRTLDVAPSGYYEWLQKPISDRAFEDARLLTLIRAVSDYIGSFYNPRRRHSHIGGVSPDDFEAAAKRR